MAKSGTARMDDFVNIMSGYHVETAAGTLAFSTKLETGYSLANNVGLIIHRLEYNITQAMMNLMLDDSDGIRGGLVTSSGIASVLATGANVVDMWEISRSKYGTAASGWVMQNMPVVTRDFTNLPGGGILVAPNPLYMAVIGTSLASVVGFTWRMFYTSVNLNDRGFRELWETWNSLRA